MASTDSGQDAVNRNNIRNEFKSDHRATDGVASFPGGPVEWLTVLGERVGDVLVYSSAYLAFIAMVEVAIVMVLLELPPSPAPIVLGLVTFAVYASDRLEDVDTDAVTNPEQAAFVHRYWGPLHVLSAAAYGLAVTLSVLGGPVALAITVLPGVFWVLYATDWLPEAGLHVQRLKDVFVLNSTVVALAWAVSLTFLPLAYAGAGLTWTTAVVFVYFFLRSFVDTEVPNVRDVEGDREIGVNTLPVVVGVDRTRRALYGIDVFTAGIVAFAAIAGHLSVIMATVLLVGLAYSLGVTSFVGRIEDEKLLSIATECEYVVVAIALAPIVYGA